MSGAAIVLKQNRLMQNFRVAGATSPATATTPEEIGCCQGWIFPYPNRLQQDVGSRQAWIRWIPKTKEPELRSSVKPFEVLSSLHRSPGFSPD